MTNPLVPKLEIIHASSTSHTTEQVVATISDLIAKRKLQPGDRLPPERELAKQLGLSRPSLRMGLRTLSSMGMLKARQGAGTFVMGGPPVLDSEPLRLLASLHGFSFQHMFETRSVLEVGAAGLAAERATGDDLATIAEEVSEMFATMNDPQQFLIHDVNFHRAVANASGNQTLATLVQMVSTVMYERRRDTIDRAHDFSDAVHHHRNIYKAIKERNPELARETMRAHIREAQKAFALEEKEQATKQVMRGHANA